jgi:hypothetical protein
VTCASRVLGVCASTFLDLYVTLVPDGVVGDRLGHEFAQVGRGSIKRLPRIGLQVLVQQRVLHGRHRR